MQFLLVFRQRFRIDFLDLVDEILVLDLDVRSFHAEGFRLDDAGRLEFPQGIDADTPSAVFANKAHQMLLPGKAVTQREPAGQADPNILMLSQSSRKVNLNLYGSTKIVEIQELV